MQVPVISLLQPFASLVVMGAKKIETRSWNTQFRGELYIHASLSKKYGEVSCRELCYKKPFNKFIDGGLAYDKLPFGAIIGKVKMLETFPSDQLFTYINHNEDLFDLDNWNIDDVFYRERCFGDYSNNRFGWLLSNPEEFVYPIAAKGKQGFWNFEMPEYFHYPDPAGGYTTYSGPPTKESIAELNQVFEKIKKSF